jgi:hypothetical protein
MSYVQNYGFAKTLIHNNKHNINNEIEWEGNYDGNIANVNLDINNNGDQKFITMRLNNEDLNNILGIQPIEVSLEQRLINDFLSSRNEYNGFNNCNKINSYKYKPIALEGALIKKKSHKKRRRKRKGTHRKHLSKK